ncbi:MAG: hypothetical protein HLUCCA11_23305 [Phormidesmis priestleyi Ana]|uniref:Uncharacterized protein n=1 Tax=Phormidesmis priestleyi Ana TaxID=1666911 RepID=A0A0N8KLR3_9CYAN|nr:MAG: hypothetical protein HLUCCA11_23305 [Phormidesmis priestleyi Ana]
MENKITAVRYIPETRELEVSFSSGARLVCPVDALEMLTWTAPMYRIGEILVVKAEMTDR